MIRCWHCRERHATVDEVRYCNVQELEAHYCERPSCMTEAGCVGYRYQSSWDMEREEELARLTELYGYGPPPGYPF